MSTDASSWNETLMKDWADAQRKYWDTWTNFASQSGLGAPNYNVNPFAAFAGANGNNPFMQNPFAASPFAANPFATNSGAFNPFQALTQNPFAKSNAGQNPFAGALEQWWSTLRPETHGDINTVAERFFDMGKTFMSMAEGVFGAAGTDQPDAAMQMWMSSMQAALQQWITQIQNNMDLVTPDLPGVSGTTLTTWAQLADSVAPWLHMSQSYLKDVAEGHLPGGIEMPGVGAAQEQLLRALSMPGLGYTREQQEGLQQLAQHLLSYHDALRAYKLAFAKTALASLNAVQKRLQGMHEAGDKIETLRALYDMWVDASEEAYAEFAMSDEYQVVYGDLVNALMQVRKDMNTIAEQQYELLHIPTRSEIDTMQHRQQEIRRDNRRLMHELSQLRKEVEDLRKAAKSNGGAAPSSPRSRARSTAPAQDSLPIDEAEDDLTAIRGVGPKMAEKLYEQGIKNFAQLAKMNKKFAEQLDETLKTQGRILRDDWIGQAKKLRG
jgi:class III poly(R)-hydroxyalkanoic acid synthase PhaE subunit